MTAEWKNGLAPSQVWSRARSMYRTSGAAQVTPLSTRTPSRERLGSPANGDNRGRGHCTHVSHMLKVTSLGKIAVTTVPHVKSPRKPSVFSPFYPFRDARVRSVLAGAPPIFRTMATNTPAPGGRSGTEHRVSGRPLGLRRLQEPQKGLSTARAAPHWTAPDFPAVQVPMEVRGDQIHPPQPVVLQFAERA